MNIFVVTLETSSPNQLKSSEVIDDMTKKLNFKFKPDQRREISAARSMHDKVLQANSLNFHGLHICKEEQLKIIQEAAAETDTRMKTVDTSLGAVCTCFTLDMSAIAKGEEYGKVLSAIRYQIITEVLNKINIMTQNKTVSQLSDRSRTALINMVSKLKAINILDDAQINKKLEDIRAAIEKDSIEVMKKELIDEVEQLNKAGAFLKFRKPEEKP